MKITLKTLHVDTESVLAQGKGRASGEVTLDGRLKIDFSEDLTPEELQRLRDGLADLTERVKVRVLSAIRTASESGKRRGKGTR